MKDPVCGMDIGEKGESITHNGKEYQTKKSLPQN